MELLDEHLLSYDSSSGYGFYSITTAGSKHLNSNVGYRALIHGKAEKERIGLEIKRLTLSDLQHSVKTNSLTFYLLVLGGILGLLSFIMQLVNQK